jgi:hypothetical protein
MAQRGEVVDHDHGAAGHGGREVGGAVDHPRLAGRGRQQRLLPEVPGAIRQRARRLHHGVAIGPQLRQPSGHLDRHALHAADLAPGGGASVDDHGRVPSRNGTVPVSAGET